jgi:hypothetical protein
MKKFGNAVAFSSSVARRTESFGGDRNAEKSLENLP